MFGQRTQIRRRAAQLLLVWLLTLASGLLNACALTPGRVHAGSWSPQSMGAVSDSTSLAKHCPDCPAPDPAGQMSSCAKFCVDASGSAPSAKPMYDAGQGLDLAPLATLTLGQVLAVPRLGTPLALPEVLAVVPEHSIPIVFLRLAL